MRRRREIIAEIKKSLQIDSNDDDYSTDEQDFARNYLVFIDELERGDWD